MITCTEHFTNSTVLKNSIIFVERTYLLLSSLFLSCNFAQWPILHLFLLSRKSESREAML
uniref:Uncharacterized protein n=1 Tax=Rhizophora mucronata TaxID=61149 RepID=A0A2P2K8R2_RHIMU